jgi:flagellar motor switch protein FliM
VTHTPFVPTSVGGPLANALSARVRSEPRNYDFRRPAKLSRDHVRVLQIAAEAFARQSTTVLTTALRTGARMDLVGIEQLGYDDYISTLTNPSFMATFDLNPLAGKGILAMPLDTAMVCVEHMLGGSGTTEQPLRPMTGMEGRVVRHLLDRLLSEFALAFAPIVRLEPELDVLEYNPALAQTSAGSEIVMVSNFTLRIGLRDTEATLCLPFNSFSEKLKSAASPVLSAAQRTKRAQASAAMSQRLKEVPVDVSVRFPPQSMSSSELLALRADDVITLKHPKNSPLEVVTNDVVFAHALSGNHRSRLAAQIVPTSPNQKDLS